MDLKAALLVEHSKNQATIIADHIIANSSGIKDFMNLFFNEDYRITQRAAFVLSVISDKKPFLIQPYTAELIHHLSNKNLHPAVKRNSLRLLAKLDIPEDQEGELLDICYNSLKSNHEPVAIQVYAMEIISRFARTYPELTHELTLIIEDKWDYASPAFKSRAGKILKSTRKV